MLYLELTLRLQLKSSENYFIWRILFIAIQLIFMPLQHLICSWSPITSSKRNILGVIEKVGKEIGTEVLKQRRTAQEIQALLGDIRLL